MDVDYSPIRLPRLADSDDVSLPEPLTGAHAVLLSTATTAANRATQIAADTRFTEVEKQRQLTELCGATMKEIGPLAEIASVIESAADEAEANALRSAIGAFDKDRLMLIANALAQRPREGRLSATMRARGGDRETAAAILNSPSELGVLADIDPRVVAGLKDVLIDEKVRTMCAATKFATTRFRVGWQNSVDVLRRLTNTPPPMGERIVRATA